MHNLDQSECHSTSSAGGKAVPDGLFLGTGALGIFFKRGREECPNLVLIVSLLRDKHLLQLQVQALNAASQPRGESVQRQQGHRLQREASQKLKDKTLSSQFQIWFLVSFTRHTDLLS